MEQAANLLTAFDEVLGQANFIRDVRDALSDGRPVELAGWHATSYHEALLFLGHAVRLNISSALLEAFFDHPCSDKCRDDPTAALQGRAPLGGVWAPTTWAALQEALRQVPRLDVGALVACLECERIRAEREVGQRPVEGARARKPDGLELIPGGFAYKGRTHDLTGRPRDMLEALVESHHRRCTASELRKVIGVDDESTTYPEQVIRDTAKTLRNALKGAVKAAGLSCKNPLPSTGKGKDLTYILALP
jgi:hypothetical protein